MRDKALICSPCSAPTEMMSFFRVHVHTRTETQTHISRCSRTDSFWFERILEVESTKCCSSIPCRKSYFYLGWRCFAGFQFSVLHTTEGTDRKQKRKKERKKRQFSLWQKLNWNAKLDWDNNCEERYWNQMFTLKGTFKSSFRMEQEQVWDGTGDVISTLCCSFKSHLHDFSSLIRRESSPVAGTD